MGATEKKPKERMGKDAAGKKVRQTYFGGWIESSTYKRLVKVAGKRRLSARVDAEREALREYVERYDGDE